MSREMGWRSTISSSMRRAVSHGDLKQANSAPRTQTWREWAGATGQRISAGIRGGGGGTGRDTERIAMFPGWAARRYRSDEIGLHQDAFDVDLFVSGFASSHRAPEFASRSQRAFMRLAKGFAALPKLDGSPLTASTEELMKTVQLPPPPEDMTDDYEAQALEQQFQRLRVETNETASNDADDAESVESTSQSTPFHVPSAIYRLHKNLESRIQPFWSSVIPARTVRLHLYAAPHKANNHAAEERDAIEYGPIATRVLTTAVDGSFQARMHVSFEELARHPGALHIAFGEATVEHELLVTAELLPPKAGTSSAARLAKTNALHIPLTHSRVRVISDVDDTVKLSGILSGSRAVFYNVFVKEYDEIVIPGMGEWYTAMWNRGVRFHYVSNGPFELLPVLMDFFRSAQLPPGSVKLRSYAGRSLFSGLLSAPAARKRAGVQELVVAFPDSSFILIGDSGEQDLQLYADIARDYPEQVLAVFIRDVDTNEAPLDDPTGQNHAMLDQMPQRSWSTASSTSSRPPTPSSYHPPSNNYFLSATTPMTTEPEPIPSMVASNTAAVNLKIPNSRAGTGMEQPNRRRAELQVRVWRARRQIPPHIPLRLFREPRECVAEADGILAGLRL
ncbi:unnamed protein product [Mycena citricolor]|uniref:Phosphatidate phosphatase APP1 catalytic domain-containing protein n=1 Tax=Mycena citricolor TaxID=2018698 RepID=A0AAD2HUE1_9AGAR|nr:unnamed protein product [Mycena citricolor]